MKQPENWIIILSTMSLILKEDDFDLDSDINLDLEIDFDFSDMLLLFVVYITA